MSLNTSLLGVIYHACNNTPLKFEVFSADFLFAPIISLKLVKTSFKDMIGANKKPVA